MWWGQEAASPRVGPAASCSTLHLDMYADPHISCSWTLQENITKRGPLSHKENVWNFLWQWPHKKLRIILVGPPIFTTSMGFNSGANSACHRAAATRSIMVSAWCSAPVVSTYKHDKKATFDSIHSVKQWFLFDCDYKLTTCLSGGCCGEIHRNINWGTSWFAAGVKAW